MASDSDPDLPVSGRVGLARLAGEVVAHTDGVTATTGPAGRWRTVGSQQTIPGVLAVARVCGSGARPSGGEASEPGLD